MAAKKPNPIDVHVGARLRQRRVTRGVSQERLGEQLGVTFQQIQKYEKGSNRIGASRLFEIARFLDIPVGYFYEGLPDDPEQAGIEGLGEAASAYEHEDDVGADGLRLSKAFVRIKDSRTRRLIIELVETLVHRGP
ncbi:MAG: helix-turn-helix transcriptional regulator [Pseudomonadota bacterium]